MLCGVPVVIARIAKLTLRFCSGYPSFARQWNLLFFAEYLAILACAAKRKLVQLWRDLNYMVYFLSGWSVVRNVCCAFLLHIVFPPGQWNGLIWNEQIASCETICAAVSGVWMSLLHGLGSVIFIQHWLFVPSVHSCLLFSTFRSYVLPVE